MPEAPPRHPARRPPPDRTSARALAVTGVAGLLVVLIAIIALIGSSGSGDSSSQEAAATPTPTPTRTPTPTPKPKPTPVPLTDEEKLERQDAFDVVRSRGFDVVRKRDYKPDDTLRVLIGRSSDGGELAFFFVNGDYLGNDSSDTSAQLRVADHEDLEVTLAYGTYEPGDAADAPSGNPVEVGFRYDAGQITPTAALPDPSQRQPG